MAKIDIYKTPIPLISYCLVTSPRELAHAEKIFGLPRVAFCAVGSEAMTQFFDSGVCIVHIARVDERDDIQTYGLLVHEAVHIYQEMIAKMREEDPSIEFEAYSIQKIAVDLFTTYNNKIKKDS